MSCPLNPVSYPSLYPSQSHVIPLSIPCQTPLQGQQDDGSLSVMSSLSAHSASIVAERADDVANPQWSLFANRASNAGVVGKAGLVVEESPFPLARENRENREKVRAGKKGFRDSHGGADGTYTRTSRTHSLTYVHTYTLSLLCVFTTRNTYAHTYAHTYTHIHTYIHTHTHTYTHIHTHTHTYTHTCQRYIHRFICTLYSVHLLIYISDDLHFG